MEQRYTRSSARGSATGATGSRPERSVAVAIRRDPGEALDGTGAGNGNRENLERPRVIAKGEGALAEQILAIAFDRGIKVRSDADLAEILSAVEVDSEIPLEALAAVAEILSYVYRATQPPAQPTGARPEAPAGGAPRGATGEGGVGEDDDEESDPAGRAEE